MDPSQKIPLNEWQTEEKRLPTLTLDQQGKPQVGERVVKQRYIHVPLIPHTICAAGEHHFEFLNGGKRQDGRVLVKCRRCPVGQQFLPGRDTLTDGKLTSVHPTPKGGE